MRTTKVLLPLLLVGALLLTSCRPWSGSARVNAPGFRCSGTVAIKAPASGVDQIRTFFPLDGGDTCADASGDRAQISMRISTTSNPGGTVVRVGLGEQTRTYRDVTSVRLRLTYKSGCNVAVLDVERETTSVDPYYCG